MPITSEFLSIASDHFDPYSEESGTEHVAMLLYSLVRMTRPRTIVESGPGYSTLFILRALADNVSDIEEEKAALIDKTKQLGSIEYPPRFDDEFREKLRIWFSSGHKAFAVDPRFYLQSYEPTLFSFEELPDSHQYVEKTRAAIAAIGHDDLFTHLTGQSCSVSALPENNRAIDLAWNDHGDYEEFFTEFWPNLKPEGGLMIFHNVPSNPQAYEAIEWMRKQRSHENDLEVLVLEESHKLNQNGCAVLRRTGSYRPAFRLSRLGEVHRDLVQFMNSSVDR